MKWAVLVLIVAIYISWWLMLKIEGISGFVNGNFALQVIGVVVGGAVILLPITVLFAAGAGP